MTDRAMKKILKYIALAASLALLASCSKEQGTVGTLALPGFELDLQVQTATKASSTAKEDYWVFITDSKGDTAYCSSWANLPAGGKILLPVGDYTLELRSQKEDIPAAAFDHPVYGTICPFSINSGKVTSLEELVCSLRQLVVTIDYNIDFLASIKADGKATASVNPANTLEFGLTYNDEGNHTYDKRKGYLAVEYGSTVKLGIDFEGIISDDGKTSRMKSTFKTAMAGQWYKIVFTTKIVDGGNEEIYVSISDFIENEEL